MWRWTTGIAKLAGDGGAYPVLGLAALEGLLEGLHSVERVGSKSIGFNWKLERVLFRGLFGGENVGQGTLPLSIQRGPLCF